MLGLASSRTILREESASEREGIYQVSGVLCKPPTGQQERQLRTFRTWGGNRCCTRHLMGDFDLTAVSAVSTLMPRWREQRTLSSM